MELRQIDFIFWEAQNRLDAGRRFRAGEPSGMLVAIARVARLMERLSATIERWARRPAQSDYVPGLRAR
ncbi:MAG TPA: hypothetical protein VFY90_15110 [Tepidiformaceae bacterium]|nr:hypothetical protein [Tepidiformaceae bacterium]